MIRRRFFSLTRKAEAVRRKIIEPSCQFVTRLVRRLTPEYGDSITFVVHRQRLTEPGNPS